MSTGYRPPSREPKGAWARHLHAARKERGWSQTRAFEEWGSALGFGSRSRSAYIAIDMGDRQPTPAEAAYLISVVGEPSDTAPEPLERPETPADLATAINALVVELRAMREEREMVEARLRALEAELPRRAPGAGEALQALSAPRGTVESGR